MKIELGTLKDKGEAMVTFLEPRVGVKPTLSGGSLEIDDDGVKKGLKPRHVKTYVKRFLYMNGVRKNYRVFVEGKELTLQEIELGEEEEEEKKEEKGSKEAEAEKTEPEKGEEKEEPKPKAKKQAPKKARSKKKDESAD